MPIKVTCRCGQGVQIPSQPDGVPIHCPVCGRTIDPQSRDDSSSSASVEIPESSFCEIPFPPSPGAVHVVTPPTLLQLLLDPTTIQRLLIFGGSLSVLGLVAWLVSLGVFKDPRILAAALGAGTLAMLSGGWLVALKTHYRLAGQALTFLACVVAPLNLWFYSAQGLLTIDGHLWVGGLVCSLLYILTVWKLRDPLFLYAVEAGVTLTVLLLLGDLQRATDSTALCFAMVVLAGISIHAESAFDPYHPTFGRKRFGLPLFFCGQVQLAVGTISLLSLQVLDWIMKPAMGDLAYSEVADNPWWAAGLWLGAAYLWFYSDFVVRRRSIYSYLAAIAVVLAEVTLLNPYLPVEALIIALSLTGIVLRAVNHQLTSAQSRWSSVANRLSMLLGSATLSMGLIRHFQMTALAGNSGPNDSAFFLIAMISVAAIWFAQGIFDKSAGKFYRTVEIICAGIAVWLGLMHGLPMIGAEQFAEQVPLLSLLPLTVVAICRRTTRRELSELIGYAATGVIALGLLISAASSAGPVVSEFLFSHHASPYAGMLFVEVAALCFVVTSSPRVRPVFLTFGGLCSWAACWKLVTYIEMPEVWLAPVLAMIGVVLISIKFWKAAAVESAESILKDGESSMTSPWLIAGDLSLMLGELIAFFQTLPWLLGSLAPIDGFKLLAVALTVGLSGIGSIMTSSQSMKRAHRFSLVMIVVAAVVAWIRTQHLADYQKIELLLEMLGVASLGWGCIERLRETDQRRFAAVSFSLWVGSLLASLPVLSCMLMHRWSVTGPSLPDELGLITAAMVMVAVGCVLQIRSATTMGGLSLGIYLAVLFGHLAYHPQVTVGVYLAAGGAVIFLTGVALSVYRERLLALPSKFTNREGIFQVIDWR